MANPYLAYALLIHAGLDGIRRNLTPDEPVNENLYQADPSVTEKLKRLPGRWGEALQLALSSGFVRGILPEELLEIYAGKDGR